MNWGRIVGFVITGLCLLSGVGYAFAHDWRRMTYFILVAGVNFTVVY